jgi:hypothetical protein
MTDVEFRFRLPPTLPKRPQFPLAVSAIILAAGCVVLFPFAAIETTLTTHESGYADNPGLDLAMMITGLGLAAIICFAVVLRGDFWLTEDREKRGFVICIGLAILCAALLGAVYWAGTWVPYLLRWDGLEVQDAVEGYELEVEGIVLLQAFLIGTASLFVGCVAGFLAWIYQFTPKLRETAARLPWPWRIGLGVPLLLGLALAVGALISWLGDGYEPPETLDAGRVDDFAVGAPKLFEEEDIWLVRLSDASSTPSSFGEFTALYDRGVESGCPLQWRPDFEFMRHRGWFVDACNGWVYDLTGRCVSQVCQGALLDRFWVRTQEGRVVVELDQVISNPEASQPAE